MPLLPSRGPAAGARLLALALLLAALFPAAARAEPAAAPAAPPPPEAPGEEIVVTATRGPSPRRDATAPVTVLRRADLERSPAKTADELLRVVPSFALFRRTSSLVSDPTAQGVNLRGIGPSGVSRSLVLVDGIPANDPYGGWVYWRGLSLLDVERIELVPGGGSALYGSYALGGVTQLVSRRVTGPAADLVAEVGSFETASLAARAASRAGPLAASLDAELLRSGGYPVVAPGARGAIDGDAPSHHVSVNARLEAHPAAALSLSLGGGFFREDQDGGTRFTTAGVRRWRWSGRARWSPAGRGVLEATVFGHLPRFEQDRGRITSAPRAAAELASSQVVPARDLGGSAAWTSAPLALLGRHTLTLGSDLRRIRGSLREDLFPGEPAPATVIARETRGEQRLVGLFAQDVLALGRALTLSLGLRYDRWDDVDARRVERLAGGTEEAQAFPARRGEQVSPKLGLRVTPLAGLTLRAAAYRAFRAPTLNERHRPFQAGLVFTEANPALGPERLRGAEAGLEAAPARGLVARLTGFWNELEDPIVNVSCEEGSPTSDTCTTTGPDRQQRQNVGEARIRGVEVDAGWRLGAAWRVALAYTFVDGRVTGARAPEQLGKALPQDPRHRASLSLAFDDPRLVTATAQLRYVGSQFEDDLNRRELPGVVLVDLSASRRVSEHLEVRLAVENLLDREYLVGRAGVDTVGQPRFVHGGIAFRFGG